jgi:uncharacterized membrane protein YgdD (TMEM256/DUF423 family)
VERTFFVTGAALAAVAVLLGAFGAHSLADRLPAGRVEVFKTAAQYQMYHSLGLLAVAFAVATWPGGFIDAAGWLFVAGIALFCGSLYALSVSGIRWLGAITPLGGICFVAGWASLAAGVWRAA